MYSGYRTTIDNSGSWSFDNNTPRNVIIFGVDNSSSSQSDNFKNDFLILGECLTFEIMEALIYQRKKLALTLVKQIQNFARVCITMPIIVIFLLMNKKSLFKTDNKNVLVYQLNFVSEVYLTDLVLLNLEKYLNIKICMVFPSITILLINLTF